MKNQTKATNPYRSDVGLFLVLIPLISAFNYYLTYSNIQLNWFLLLTFCIDTAQGYLAWLAVRTFIIYLDRRMPYEKNSLYRITLQLILTTILGLLIISLTTELVSWIFKGEPANKSFYQVDVFIISIWFFVINGIYIGLYYYQLWKTTEEKYLQTNRSKLDGGLLVRLGKEEQKLSFDKVVGFFVDGEYVAAADANGKKYYLDQSLDKLETELPSDIFFRLNRQFILNHQIISGFKRSDHGKLVVQLKPTEFFPSETTVSRLKASSFKSWFRTV
jgi:DNA-binding LytR/AlgR family response regulator